MHPKPLPKLVKHLGPLLVVAVPQSGHERLGEDVLTIRDFRRHRRPTGGVPVRDLSAELLQRLPASLAGPVSKGSHCVGIHHVVTVMEHGRDVVGLTRSSTISVEPRQTSDELRVVPGRRRLAVL